MGKIIRALIAFIISVYIVTQYNNEYIIKYNIFIPVDFKNNTLRGQIYYTRGFLSNKYINKIPIIYKKKYNKFQSVEIIVKDKNMINEIYFCPIINSNKKVKIRDFKITHNLNTYKMSMEINNGSNCIKTIDSYNSIKVIILFIIFYLLFELLSKYKNNFIIDYLILSFIIVVYTIYSFLFSFNYPMTYKLIGIFAVLSFFVAIKNGLNNYKNYIKNSLILLFVYLLMIYINAIYSFKYFNEINHYKILFIIVSIFFIPIGFYGIKNFSLKFFRVYLTLLLLIFFIFILLNYCCLDLDKKVLLRYIINSNQEWVEKYYMYLYILLFFLTISFFNFKKNKVTIGMLLLLSCFIVFIKHPLSSKVSLILGFNIYLILLFLRNYNIKIKILFFIYFFLISIGVFIGLMDININYIHNTHILTRIIIYKKAFILVKESLLFGYGFENFPGNELKYFKNEEHPHNLFFRFWLEFGIFGVIFLLYFSYKFLKMLVEKTEGCSAQPAIFAMVTTFVIMISFSWDMWHIPVVLAYGFFIAMIMLVMNICRYEKKEDDGD